MREIKVYVGCGLDNDGIKDALNASNEDGGESGILFEVAHALLHQHSDDRAEIYSVSVESVSTDSHFQNQVHIELVASWNIYVGCRNMNSAGEEELTERATYLSDGHLVFLVPAPRRPANYC